MAPTELCNREDIKTPPWKDTEGKNGLIIQELIHTSADTKEQRSWTGSLGWALQHFCAWTQCAQKWTTSEALCGSGDPRTWTHSSCRWDTDLQVSPPAYFNCHHFYSHRILPGSVPLKKNVHGLQIEHPSNIDELCLCDPVHSKKKSGSDTGWVVHERKDLLRFGAIWTFTFPEAKLGSSLRGLFLVFSQLLQWVACFVPVDSGTFGPQNIS